MLESSEPSVDGVVTLCSASARAFYLVEAEQDADAAPCALPHQPIPFYEDPAQPADKIQLPVQLLYAEGGKVFPAVWRHETGYVRTTDGDVFSLTEKAFFVKTMCSSMERIVDLRTFLSGRTLEFSRIRGYAKSKLVECTPSCFGLPEPHSLPSEKQSTRHAIHWLTDTCPFDLSLPIEEWTSDTLLRFFMRDSGLQAGIRDETLDLEPKLVKIGCMTSEYNYECTFRHPDGGDVKLWMPKGVLNKGVYRKLRERADKGDGASLSALEL